MKEYIEKDAARDLMEQALVDEWEIQYADDRLDEIPAADVLEVRHGRWTRHYVGQERTPWGSDCSVCGEWLVIDRLVMQEKYHYCPNCGARMDGGANDGKAD